VSQSTALEGVKAELKAVQDSKAALQVSCSARVPLIRPLLLCNAFVCVTHPPRLSDPSCCRSHTHLLPQASHACTHAAPCSHLCSLVSHTLPCVTDSCPCFTYSPSSGTQLVYDKERATSESRKQAADKAADELRQEAAKRQRLEDTNRVSGGTREGRLQAGAVTSLASRCIHPACLPECAQVPGFWGECAGVGCRSSVRCA
jgi:hypothetical protein